jgi:hypothetical protein
MMVKPNYPWRECYVHAILEVNPVLRSVQICEAVVAIEQRRLSSVDTDEERWALANAEEGIKALMAESGLKAAC